MPVGFSNYDLYLEGGKIGFNTAQGDLYGVSATATAPTWVASTAPVAPAGSAVSFNGVSDQLNVGNKLNMGTSDFTLGVWIKGDPTMQAWGRILDKGYATGFTLGRVGNTDSVGFEFLASGSQGNSFGTTTDVIDNTWHYITLVKQGTQASIYADGVLENTETVSGASQLNSLPLLIGSNPGEGTVGNWKGQLDDISVWGVALTQAQIQANMGQAPTGSETGLLASWQFNEGAGQVASDITGHGNDAVFPTDLLNQWVQVTAVFHNGDATLSKLYLNGIAQPLGQSFGTTSTNRIASTQVRISGWMNDENYGFHGSLDDVAFYNRALTQSEVTALANGSSASYAATVLGTDPIAYYRLDETSGTTVVDSSPYHNDGDYGTGPRFETSGAFLYSTAPSPITITVINTADSGPGTLRQALLDANAIPFPVPITIDFNIPSGDPGHVAGSNGGYYLIQPLTPLPIITRDHLTIDGRSQVAFDGDTNPNPEIVLDGRNLIAGNGLQLTTNNNIVDGLDIERFNGYGIYVNGGSSNWIWGNYIGTDPTGTLAEGNASEGIYVVNGGNNIIGTNGDGVNDAAERNVISGNGA